MTVYTMLLSELVTGVFALLSIAVPLIVIGIGIWLLRHRHELLGRSEP